MNDAGHIYTGRGGRYLYGFLLRGTALPLAHKNVNSNG